MKNKLWSSGVLLLSLLILSACTVQLVSDYDSRTEKSVAGIRSKLSTLFFELEEQTDKKPDCTYENHKEKYKQLRVDLDVMAMRERTKPNNKKTAEQVEVLDEAIKKLQKKHQKSCLNRLEIQFIDQPLSRMLDSILRLEEAKLRGSKKPSLFTTVR